MAQTSTGVTKGADATETWGDAVVADIAELYSLINALALNTSVGSADLGTPVTTTSTTYVDVSANTNINITTGGGNVLVLVLGGAIGNDTLNKKSMMGLDFDGDGNTGIQTMAINNTSVTILTPFAFAKLYTGVGAGAHTIKLRHKTDSGGTSRLSDGKAVIIALELTL